MIRVRSGDSQIRLFTPIQAERLSNQGGAGKDQPRPEGRSDQDAANRAARRAQAVHHSLILIDEPVQFLVSES